MKSAPKSYAEREDIRRWAEDVLAGDRSRPDPARDALLARAMIGHRLGVIRRGRRVARFFSLLVWLWLFATWYLWPSRWVFLTGVLILLSAYLWRCVRYWIRVRSVMDRAELPFDALRPGLLFLRSFGDDEWRYNLRGTGFIENLFFHLEEEMLFDVQLHGVPVAVGGTPDSRTGLIRIKLPEGTWRTDVAALVARSEFVLVFPKFSSGLEWEIDYMLRPDNRNKLLVLVPAKGFLDIGTRWGKFICQMIKNGVVVTPKGGWDPETIREQDEMLPDSKPIVRELRKLHYQSGGDYDSYCVLRHFLLTRTVGCTFDGEGKPVLFSSTKSGGWGGWWRPLPHSYRYGLKKMVDYKRQAAA